ncbi:MAG: 50S ribosomal protein L24 [Deltaproteobacteria bacterium]|nr:MAG: 50S ribosomal protein L24 [Deltaproteobacteria bacterium]
MKRHVKKNDIVVVIAGKEKGKRGKVLKVFPEKGRVIVEGLNMIKRHTRPNQMVQQGGIIEREAPISISNVQLYDPKADRPVRIGYKVLEDGRKVRYSVKTGEILDQI